MDAIHYFNGEYLKKEEIRISPDDVGFLRGHSVFDFFRIEQGVPVFMEDHLDRLEASAAGMRIEMPMSRAALKDIIFQLIKTNNLDMASLKVFLTGGLTTDGFTPSEPTVLILNQPFKEPDQGVYETGASLLLHQYHRDFPKVKTTQYAKALSLQKEWQKDGHIDVLYHNGELVSEVSRSSVFIFKKGILKTNKRDVLKGITQTNVLRAIEGHFEVEVGDIKLEELLAADEMFITSTTKRILPIVKVDNKRIGAGVIGENTKKLMELFNAYLADYISQHQ